jgi:hypothetical protein
VKLERLVGTHDNEKCRPLMAFQDLVQRVYGVTGACTANFAVIYTCLVTSREVEFNHGQAVMRS